jgi:four helix bundle protein
MVRDVRVLADRIGRFDRDQARQLQRSSVSVVLNIAEGAAVRDGRRRARYGDALGSAMETRANLEAAEAIGYLESIDAELLGRFETIIGTLTRLVR